MSDTHAKENFNQDIPADAMHHYELMDRACIAEQRLMPGNKSLIRIFNFASDCMSVQGYLEQGNTTDYLGTLPMTEINPEHVERARKIAERYGRLPK